MTSNLRTSSSQVSKNCSVTAILPSTFRNCKQFRNAFGTLASRLCAPCMLLTAHFKMLGRKNERDRSLFKLCETDRCSGCKIKFGEDSQEIYRLLLLAGVMDLESESERSSFARNRSQDYRSHSVHKIPVISTATLNNHADEITSPPGLNHGPTASQTLQQWKRYSLSHPASACHF